MTEYNYTDEIDLFELMETLWLEKKTIILSMVFFLALSGAAYALMSKKMTSEIAIDIRVSQGQDKEDKFASQTYSDFASYFFNASVFNQWKKTNDSSLNYDMISQSEMVDGLLVTKKKQNVSFITDKKNNTAKIKVVFKDKSDLLAVDDFVSHVNQIMTLDYLKKSENNLKDMQSHIANLKEGNADLVKSMLGIKNYIERLKDAGAIFNKSYPTQPKNKLSLLLCIFLGLFVGGGVGCGYVLFRKSWSDYQKRKQQLLSAQVK